MPVTTNGQTTYEDGVVGDLAVNVKVEVEGEVNSSGVLVARKVEFKSGDDDDDGDDDSIDGRVEGDVTAVNAGAGTLAIAGVTVTVTAETRYEDQTGVAGQAFGLDDITVGDYVEVRGDPGTGATLTAADRGAGRCQHRGPAARAGERDRRRRAAPSSVLGVPVTTDGGTQYRDADDNAHERRRPSSPPSAPAPKSRCSSPRAAGAIVADELELEDATTDRQPVRQCPKANGAVLMHRPVFFRAGLAARTRRPRRSWC